MILPKDQKSRDLCAVPGAYNVIVEAGAGTGKTTILIARLCYLILGKNIPIDKIIALTFTEKAASEIKIRLLLKMQQILADIENDPTAITLRARFNKTNEELQKNIQTAFELAERAQISTIHGFCLQILRRYPLEAGLAPDARVDDGLLAQNIFDKQWSVFLEHELARDSRSAPAWKELLEAVHLDDIKNFARSLLTPGFEHYHPLKAAPAIKDFCLQYAGRAGDLLAKYNTKKRAVETTLEAALAMLQESAEFFTHFKPVKSKYSIEKKPGKPADWDGDDFEEAVDIINFANDLKTDNQLLILKTFNCVQPFIKTMREMVESENILSFNAIIEHTKQLLKKYKAVRAELKKEYESILIDEFQDTDPSQGEILLFLAEEHGSSADHWQDIKLQHGKLFTVGDPKQSIYRFRGADITAYQKFTDLMAAQNALKCFLQTNFRSSRQIIAFANRFGGAAIEEIPSVQPKYVPIESGRNLNAPNVCLAAVAAPAETKIGPRRHNQAQFIAAWIKDNVFKTKLSSGKIMTYKDIAILLRSTTAADIYTDALKRFDIKYTVEETKNFYNAQEVSDIINLLKTINDPYDKTALLGVLRSPFAMLADDDILTLSQNNALNIFADVSFMPAARRIYDILKDLYYKAGRITLDDLLAEIIDNTNLCALEVLAGRKEQIIANIFKFVSVARAARGGGALSLGQFLYYAENYSKEQNREGESPLAEESLDTVSVMTMHKAKGLEFPVVILADIGKKEVSRKDMRPEYIYNWAGNMQGLRLGALADGVFTVLEQSSRAHRAAEELRIIYVALTRAKERLLIAGDLTDDNNTISAALQRAGCWPAQDFDGPGILDGDAKADIIYHKFTPPDNFIDIHYIAAREQSCNFDAAAWLETWQQRTAAYKADTRTRDITPSAQGLQPETGGPKDGAAIVGTICHDMLFNIFTGINNLNPHEYPAETAQAAKIIENFKQSPLFKKLKDMRLLAAELPFAMYDEDGNFVNGIIDAVFSDKDGSLFIADYKSDNISVGDIPARSAAYAGQLALYKAAVQKICLGKQIKTAVIYLRPGKEFLYV